MLIRNDSYCLFYGSCLRHCTLSARLSYICIPNRSKIRSFAKKVESVGDFTKYGVQPQVSGCHVVGQAKSFLCKKGSAVSAQKGGLRPAIKACLHCKQALIDAQMHLGCHAKKPSLQCNQGFFGGSSPFFPARSSRIPAFTACRNSWNGSSRCQIILPHMHYICMCRQGVIGKPAATGGPHFFPPGAAPYNIIR